MLPSLDEILVRDHGLPPEALEDARRVSAEKGVSLGDVLAQKNLLQENAWLQAVGEYYGLEVWNELPLDAGPADYTQQTPIQFLKKHKMVPLFLAEESEEEQEPDSDEERARQVFVAVADPSDFDAVDDLAALLNTGPVTTILAPSAAITSAINMAYDMARDSAEQLVADMEEGADSIISEIEKTADLLEETSDAPIIKLVNHILSQAVKARASDIHIEPYQTILKVRYRVDGVLYDLIKPPKRIQSALVSRIKVMAKLNIAEKRLPQDGRIEIRIGDRNVDIRVSTIPTTFGERIVLRLLDKSTTILKLTDVGFTGEQLRIIHSLIHQPHGIILVTGPTGSGKTTSLYAVLSTINTEDINIITIEDPVEYQISGIGQIQVNPKIDLTFARGLRSIVRQDPDVILVGEIRDMETAEIAVQSSLTGHLVFSTLHTNDSASAITRLIDMNVEPFLISSSVLAVMAQRLVRVLCPHCKEPHTPDEASMAFLKMTPEDLAHGQIFKPVGCPECLQTGYHGRKGIFEIMLMDQDIKSLLLSTSDANTIKAKAVENGMITLRQDGVNKVLAGVTSIEEVFRVTQQ
ncbi:type II secretion system protein E (GspE) [Desulfatibacillum alkenivorans DSM 16219]|jgi:general secretion pathway protein E|uniref:protein-secreting ATPase n=1 Tax=Desulfatibacillum alkenivorans DSM 16219 TaxID=1121393 RepID=A0A1M6BVE1_9BACT|nr:type II secretion system ATPase GspE [Desulfatibacillum alkenivorans]SHI52617.1 type II secretion system protein E (GspE) [Desulfatibacillum alkenivorans DSM 16219]